MRPMARLGINIKFGVVSSVTVFINMQGALEGRAFFAWNEQARLSFYPLVCMEDVCRGLHKVQVACLEKQDDGSYTIDPRWQGVTKHDRAFNSLIFKVPGEGFMEIEGGVAGKRAWSLVMA